MITKYIKGDIRNTELQEIAHGVNCQNAMGAGVARALFEKWPEVKSWYHQKKDQILGDVQVVISGDKTIYNLFTQDNYFPRDVRNVNYAAIVKAFDLLQYTSNTGKVAIPKIGCGLAGGDWNIVEQLINDTVGNKLELWVYEI